MTNRVTKAALAPCVAVFAVILLFGALAPLFATITGPDFDVAYIKRTPMYWKYNVAETKWLDPDDSDNGKPYMTASEWTKQRWPNTNETVTYTAVIKNPGTQSTPANVAYKWYYDDLEVKSGTLPIIVSQGSTTVTYSRQWAADELTRDPAHKIKFVADVNNQVAEVVETNNTREDLTNALGFRLHIWQSAYNWMRTNGSTYDSQLASFDQWAQRQIGYFNAVCAQSIWEAAPQGVKERIRLDEIVIENDSLDPNTTFPDLNWDGSWPFPYATEGYNRWPAFWLDNLTNITAQCDFLMHEWGHQNGMHDTYMAGIDYTRNYVDISADMPPGAIQIGHEPTRLSCVMNGGDHYNGLPLFGDLHAWEMNNHLHKRRGYHGEYMNDLPTTCRIRLVDIYNRPISNANITFWQESQYQIYDSPDFTLTTDANGICTLPNRTCYPEVPDNTTGTGHVFHDNPWSLIHGAGANSVLMCKIVDSSNRVDYQFLEVHPFNIAFRAGNTSTWTYDMQCNLSTSSKPTTQTLYGVKMVSATKGYTVGANRTALYWNGTSWAAQTVTPTGTWAMYAVDFNGTSTTTAYAVGDGGRVLKCTNSGAWNSTTAKPNTTNALKAVSAISASNVWVAGDGGVLWQTTNGGGNWYDRSSRLPLGFTNNIRGIDFFGTSNGILVCNGAQIFYTTDGGGHWYQASGTAIQDDITSCVMCSTTEAWACTSDGDIIKSTNGGQTWTLHMNWSGLEDWLCIDMKAGGYGWCGGGVHESYGGACLYRFCNSKWLCYPTTTYQTTSNNGSDTVYSVSLVDQYNGWAVGKNGMLLRLMTNRTTTPPVFP